MALPSCSDLRSASVQQVSAGCIIGTLACTGVGLFVWMALESWSDLVGVSVGVVFLLLAALQTAFTVFWHMADKRHKAEYAPSRDAVAQEIEKDVAI